MAYKRVRQREMEKWERTQDLATPVERELLNTLQELRRDMGRLKIISRFGNGYKATLHVLRTPGNSYGGRRGGVYVMSVQWIRGEIRRVRREREAEARQEAFEQIGAYI